MLKNIYLLQIYWNLLIKRVRNCLKLIKKSFITKMQQMLTNVVTFIYNLYYFKMFKNEL